MSTIFSENSENFLKHKDYPLGLEDRQQARHLARCSQCGGELYAWERVYYLEGEYICPDCLGDYARARFAPYLAPLSDWRERKI